MRSRSSSACSLNSESKSPFTEEKIAYQSPIIQQFLSSTASAIEQHLDFSNVLYLSWINLSKLIKMHHCISWQGYTIQQHYISMAHPSVFMEFRKVRALNSQGNLVVRRSSEDHSAKLHIALRDEDIQNAFNPILTVLRAQETDCFKIVLQHQLQNFITSGQNGKIFTIYLGEKTGAQGTDLARAIEDTLQKLKRGGVILSPEKRATEGETRVDQTIANCEFVTLAYPRETAGSLTSPAACGLFTIGKNTASTSASDSGSQSLLDEIIQPNTPS